MFFFIACEAIIAHSHTNVHTKLYSFRFDCKIVSLTAAKTNRIFSVSVCGKKGEKKNIKCKMTMSNI